MRRRGRRPGSSRGRSGAAWASWASEYPEAYGGAGGDFPTTVVFWEELARCRSNGVAMGIFVHTDMASPHLWHGGTEAQKRRWMPAICRGDAVCAIAVTEPGGFYRDARLWTIGGGTSEIMKEIIAKRLGF